MQLMPCRLIKVRTKPPVLMYWCIQLTLPSGAGAGQAIEDGYILGKALRNHLESTSGDLCRWMDAYQALRLPRAQRAQRTSREAGEVFELQAEGLRGKSFEECMPELQDRLKSRMDWVWLEDLDVMYDNMVLKMETP